MSKKSAREKICKVASGMLSGAIGLLEGTRAIVNASAELDDDERESPSFLILIGIESDMDDIPLGAVRDLWDREALATRSPSDFLQRNEKFIVDACKELLQAYSDGGPDRS